MLLTRLLATALILVGGHQVAGPGTVAVTQSGTWTVQPGNTANTTPWLVKEGSIASAVPTGATYNAGIATTATPTKATAGNLVGAQYDVQGRLVMVEQAPRELTGMQSTTLTATTTATTCVTAGAAGVKNDITSIVFVNSSATGTVMTLSDGTNSYTYYCAPTAQSPTVVYFVPLAETTAATAWTAKCTTSVSSVFVTVTYVKNA